MTKKKRILLVEDEPHLAFNLEYNLQAEGYQVVPAVDGWIALQKLKSEGPFDLVVLDVMLPEVDGFSIAKRIRESDRQTGILMLTARATEADVITGLEAGADDYMTKPFHLKEFLLRVNRMMERSSFFSQRQSEAESRFEVAGINLDLDALRLHCANGQFKITQLEALLLRELMLHRNKILTREHLLDKVWGVGSEVSTRTVDNFILRLRKYLEKDPSNPQLIESVRGRGYRFLAE